MQPFGNRLKFIASVFLVITFFFSSPTFAGSSPFSLRASVGAVHLPLSDWSDFFRGMKNEYYQKSNPNFYYAWSFNYSLSKSHSIYLGTELIKTSASLSTTFISIGYFGDTTEVIPIVIKWKFQGVPITLGYEYKLTTFNQRFSPVLGIGVSYFISKVVAEEYDLTDSFFPYSFSKQKRTGEGYGFHASLGLISQLTESFSMISQVRYRFSDGMGFTDKKDAIKVEFTGFDFSVGIGWNF